MIRDERLERGDDISVAALLRPAKGARETAQIGKMRSDLA